MHRPRLVPPWGGCPWWTSGSPLRLAPPTQRPVAGITGRMWPLGASSSSSDRRSLLQPARDPGGQCGRGGRSILRSPGARQRPVPPPLSLSTPSTPSCSGPSRACPARWPTRPPSPPEASRPGGRRRVRADPHPRVGARVSAHPFPRRLWPRGTAGTHQVRTKRTREAPSAVCAGSSTRPPPATGSQRAGGN